MPGGVMCGRSGVFRRADARLGHDWNAIPKQKALRWLDPEGRWCRNALVSRAQTDRGLRRTRLASVTMPVPRSTKDEGSGIGLGVPGRNVSGPVPKEKMAELMVVFAVMPVSANVKVAEPIV